ncbi:Vms1/Ankzf1 family peptidyl-tRNA hydrolase [Desertimonas flava]|uniref:baeRF2 domain-containing protein n=1 Tax=Desertimonas flava TaxID=2064846 RepID=UPI000E34DDAB|nr:Vms1/Ankzf1 family peptidyl-tRNA hydrolase [Desertimonas flava]
MVPHADLRAFNEESDWFATITLPTPSDLDDARARFDLEWRDARAQLTDTWQADELDQLDRVVGDLHHRDSAGLVIVQARNGPTLVEHLDEPVVATVHEGPVPRWATVIEGRQRTIAHVIVETDRAGADITAFDGGTVLCTDTVVGDTEHIHRGHPGGWSQRRFQQRAENTWEDNAREVADAVAEVTQRVDAQLVAVAGDVRAQTFLLEHLPTDVADIAVKVEAGSPGGIADEVVRQLSNLVAERVTAAADSVRAGLDSDLAATDADTIVDALRQGRVETLLVHDDLSTDDDVDSRWLDGARLVDRAIVAALATDAEVIVVPKLAIMDAPVAATMRW